METMNNVRTIESRVDIAYGNEEISDNVAYDSGDKNPVSNFETLYNNNHIPKNRAFTLEAQSEHSLGAGRSLIDPAIVGWWSNALSGSGASGNGGYAFTVSPKITLDFGKARPIKMLEIYGDEKLNEFPVMVRIKTCSDTGTVVFDRTFPNTEVKRTINLLTDLSVNNLPSESFRVDNGYITDIAAATVEILEWNLPNRVSKIYRCYDDIVERYSQDELKRFECVHEAANSGEIKFGLISGSCSVTLLNNKDRKFDLGYLKDMAHINKRVMPYVKGNGTALEKLGTFFIKEWDISQDNMFVDCKANDRLLDFQDIRYKGLMPQTLGETKTFKELFAEVLDYANTFYVRKFAYKIDESLGADGTDINIVEPYLPRESVWSVLQMLCDASMSFVYVDKDDVICVKSELFDNTAETESGVTVNTGNAFGIKIPFFADMSANRVEIPYYVKTVKEDEELCKIEVKPGTKEYEMQFEDFCEMDRAELFVDKTPEVISFNKDLSSDFIFHVSISADQSNYEKATIKFFGTKITFDKKEHSDEKKESFISLYTHADCKLIQNKVAAEHIANRILEIYKSGTRSSSADWRGSEKMSLFDRYRVTDRFDGEAAYQATYIKNTVDGGFRQEVKGIQKKVMREGGT